jgi:prophage regulatory protein
MSLDQACGSVIQCVLASGLGFPLFHITFGLIGVYGSNNGLANPLNMNVVSKKAAGSGEPVQLNTNEISVGDRLLRLSEVLRLVPVARSTWFAGVRSGRFPRPISLGPRIAAWRLRDIQQILENGVGS